MSSATVDLRAWDRRRETLDRIIDHALQQQLVGAVALVCQHGQKVYERVAGFADREARRPMGLDTLFRYSSLTKPIVTVAALSLVAQGKLELGQPVTQWLPEFRPRLPSGAEPVITLHHLLTHTAGLSYPFLEPEDGPYHRAGISDGLDSSGISLTENLRRISGVPLSYVPGTQWQYSVAMDVMGAVIEKATGESLGAAVSRLVTTPLGMRDTGFAVVDPERLAVPYADDTPVPARMREPHDVPASGSPIHFSPARALSPHAFASGGAGMVGSATDFLRFLEAVRTGDAALLPQDLAARMSQNQTGDVAVALRGPGWRFGYGGALLVDPADALSPQSAGTLSWGGVYGLSWFIDLLKGLTVVTATNTAVAGMNGPVTVEIRDTVYA